MKRSANAQSPNPLQVLGLSAPEERLYRALLAHEQGTVTQLARSLGLSPASSRRLLRSLEKRGLVTQSPDRTAVFSPVAPDLAAEVLIAQRQNDLHQARAQMIRLGDSIRGRSRVRRAGEQVVETMGPQTAGHMFAQLFKSSMREILCLERLPILVASSSSPNETYLQCLARGVRCRAITDTELLNYPGTMERLRVTAAAGEQYRTLSSLPFKLLVFDRRIAIIPLDLSRPDGPVLLVRASSLLDALCEMFEMLWRSATPFDHHDSGVSSGHTQPTDAGAALVQMLAHGLNDKAIQHELKISSRTVARRIVELTKGLGATTRFQAGWLAALATHGATPRD